MAAQEARCVQHMREPDAGRQRSQALAYWRRRAEDLEMESLDEIFSMKDASIRRLFLKNKCKGKHEYDFGEFVHLALYRALAKETNATDAKYVEEFAAGLPIIGQVRRSGRWAQLPPAEPELSEDALYMRAWEIQERIAKRAARPSEKNICVDLWKDMIQDRDLGHCVGPFRRRRDVTEFVGTSHWIPTERFGVVQKGRTRGVDNAAADSGSELNAATVATEKLQLPCTDANVGMVKHLAQAIGAERVAAWVLDESSAYRQIPVAPGHRRYAVIALAEPETGFVCYFVMVGHSFGLVSAV